MSDIYSAGQKFFLLLGVLISAGIWWFSFNTFTNLGLHGLEIAGQSSIMTPAFVTLWAAVVATVVVAVPWILFVRTTPQALSGLTADREVPE